MTSIESLTRESCSLARHTYIRVCVFASTRKACVRAQRYTHAKKYFFVSVQILYLAKDWPEGYAALRDRARRAFLINRQETDPRKIEQLIGRAEYVAKEVEALYMLKKYRTMKRRYYK